MSGIQEVDVLMAGAGGGAYPAAFRLARAKMTVVMVDPKGVMSGNCLAEGCVPSKAVREVAHHRARHGRFEGYGLPGRLGVDYGKVVAHKDSVQRLRYDQHKVELSAEPKIRLVKGRVRFLDAHTVAVEGGAGGGSLPGPLHSGGLRKRHRRPAVGGSGTLPHKPGFVCPFAHAHDPPRFPRDHRRRLHRP